MKTDLTLGLEVKKHLVKMGLETPMVKTIPTNAFEKIKDAMTTIMETLRLDLSDDSLIDTPSRVAKMYLNESFSGLNYDNFPKCTTIENKMYYDQMICVNDITVHSKCEHHFETIDGYATVAYIPKNRVLGLSKINRLVQFFSKRPQVQERLTTQIAEALKYILETEDVAVMIKAKHFCVAARGVGDTNSLTTTVHLGGNFMSSELRKEFYDSRGK